ncbi:MAG: hypothetical protein RL272_179 [Candidatus Parcubacteria bacterium]|jgi:ADP-ribosylglycohydrolase
MITFSSAFLDSIRGGFIGLGIGDALGVPVETMSHDAILAATGGRGVEGYLEPKQTRVKDTANLPPGSTSDDTQLALVTSRSLCRSRGFNLVDQGRALVEEYEASTFGWGGTTTEAAIAIKRWIDSGGKEGRHPECPAPPPKSDGASAGSGPAMKILPLAFHDLLGPGADEMIFLSHAMELGMMTHGDVRASIASVALGHAIAAFSRTPRSSQGRSFRRAVETHVMAVVERAEKVYVFARPQKPPFSACLARAFALIDDPVALRTEVNASFLAVHSVPFAIATALRHSGDFRTGVLEAVNAGRDTDTTGGMVGAMIGSRVGIGGVTAELIDGLRGKDGIIAEADLLAAIMHGYDPLDAKRVIAPWLRDKTH